MYIFKNAIRCIARAKGRNILIGIIVLLLSVSSCIGLSIKESNKTLREKYKNNMEITASVTLKKRGRNDKITEEQLKTLAENSAVKAFYRTSSLYFTAGDGIEPLDVTGDFEKNKNFKKDHGNVKSGEKTTTSSKGATTEVTSDDSDSGSTENGVTPMSNKIGSHLLLLNNDTAESSSGTSESSQPDTEETENPPSDSSEPDDINPEPPEFPEGDEEIPPEPPEGFENEDDNKSENGTDKNTQSEKGQKKSNSTSDSKTSDNNSAKKGNRTAPPDMGNGGGKRTFIREGDTIVNNQIFFNMASQNDFTVVGADSDEALPDYVVSLYAFDTYTEDSLNCVISKNLADENSLKKGDTFTLKNPSNDKETYKFTVAAICDTSSETDSENTSSNASFADNIIYITKSAVEKIVKKSAKTNKSSTDNALTATVSGTFKFANLDDYNTFSGDISDEYTLISEDVSNYETSVTQLEALGKYATYFLLVIFIIGAFVLIIINLFSIRDRKYEIGVLTAIGMKKSKVAMQFITELFIVTFIALIIGSGIGAVSSVPVTNKLLTTINTTEQVSVDTDNNTEITPPDKPENMHNGFAQNNYIASIDSATDMTVILEMIAVGLVLTLISSLSATVFIMRYEPLKILSNRD